MFVKRLSSSRGNNRYGGVRKQKFLRNTNKAMLYLCLQEPTPQAERYFLVFYGEYVYRILCPILCFVTTIISHFS